MAGLCGVYDAMEKRVFLDYTRIILVESNNPLLEHCSLGLLIRGKRWLIHVVRVPLFTSTYRHVAPRTHLPESSSDDTKTKDGLEDSHDVLKEEKESDAD